MADRIQVEKCNQLEWPRISIGQFLRAANRKVAMADRAGPLLSAGHVSRTQATTAASALSMRGCKRLKMRRLHKGHHTVVVHENQRDGVVVVRQNRSG